MQVRYEEELVEGAVFVCVSGKRRGIPPILIHRFHREREKLYAILDPDERNAAFFKLHIEWFREWALEKALSDLIAQFPLLNTELSVLAFRKARTRADEGAELYVSAAGKNGVIALRAERFSSDETLAAFFNHELMHLCDMVDPAFGYSRELNLPGLNPSQQRLTRERYRLLWDITIDGRLTLKSRATTGLRESHWNEFTRAHAFWPENKRADVFDSLWTGPAPRHTDLLSLAADPRNLLDAHQPLPGAPCPLCGFPAFEWAPVPFSAQTTAAIRAEFPHWRPEQGACARCVEIYEVAARSAPLPA